MIRGQREAMMRKLWRARALVDTAADHQAMVDACYAEAHRLVMRSTTDAPAIAQAAVRAAVTEAQAKTDLPLFAGGRSFGGCMTSRAQAEMPLPGILGLVFFAYPLHPAGKPSTGRADHLADVQVLCRLRRRRPPGQTQDRG